MNIAHRILLTLTLLAATGCEHQPTRPSAEDAEVSDLSAWIDQEAAPYVAEQLASQHRFRGEPVLLVKLDGSSVQPRIDGLTRELRDRIRDRLLDTPGVTLPWYPTAPEPKHHRRLQDLNCRPEHRARYFIGVETTQTTEGQFSVSLRALDLDAAQWISGFGLTWRGQLTNAEQRARAQSRPDESLRGLRVLPFDVDEPDLAAEYVANNLSCLLRQQDADELLVYVQPLPASPHPLDTVMDLVDNQLARMQEVRITEDRERADYVLHGEAHEIQPGLAQLWLVLTPKSAAEHLPGVDTATYVRTVAPGAVASLPAGPDLPPMEKPVLTPEPAAPGECGEDTEGWETDGCRRLRATVSGGQRLFVLSWSASTGARNWSAETCGRLTDDWPRSTLLIPLDPGVRESGGTVYAIAVRGAGPASRLERHLYRLPPGCKPLARRSMSDGELESWLRELDDIMAQDADRFAWSARRFAAGEAP